MAKIRISNVMFYGFIGIYEYEREQGQKFYFDVELVTKDDTAAEQDNPNATVDTAAVYDVIKRAITDKRFMLLEALGVYIGDKLLKRFSNVAEVTTTIRKPNVPIAGPIDYVEVEVTRRAQ